jgi:hypothetical protein
MNSAFPGQQLQFVISAPEQDLIFVKPYAAEPCILLRGNAEAQNERKYQAKDPVDFGSAQDHDNFDAEAGWLATGDDGRLRK